MKKILLYVFSGLIAFIIFRFLNNSFYCGYICGLFVMFTWFGIDEYIK